MSSSLGGASFYADFGALGALKQGVKSSDPQALRAAAQQFESLFTDMMLKAMRAAKLGDGLGESDETDFYQDMYDQQLALQMSRGKGLGLADLLVQQLTRSRAGASDAGGTSTSAAGAHSGAASATGCSQGAPTARGAAGTAGGGSTADGVRNGAQSGAAQGARAGASRARRIGFVRMLEPYAQRAGARLGVSADSLIAQAALETGWGQRMPSSAGYSSNNLFGIKAGAAFSGQAARATTTEYAAGTPRASVQAFRAYGSVQQGVTDYVALLRSRAGYHGALGTGSDVAAFASALQRGGYATDPHYATKLSATAAAVRALRLGTEDAGLKLAAERPTTSGVDSA